MEFISIPPWGVLLHKNKLKPSNNEK